MENNKDKSPGKCLHCGKEIPLEGRSDRKFCCDACRHRYHNYRSMMLSSYKEKTNKKLEKNYKVLRLLLEAGANEIPLQDAIANGFDGNYATAMFRNEKITDYNCYDIGYRISPGRIFKIHQLELSLQNYKTKK